MPQFSERLLRMTRGYIFLAEDDRQRHGLHARRLRASGGAGTLLYIHGLGESALCFERLMADPRLDHWQHLALDLEGYGKSTWADEPLSLDQHADLLGRLVETPEMDLDSIVVLGHSMGGVIGARLCELLGPRARAFINVEGNISLSDCGYSSRAVKYSLEAWLEHGFERVLDVIYGDEGESAEVSRAYGASIQMCDPRAFHRNSEELVEVSTAKTMAGRLAALETDVIYVHGMPRGTGAHSQELLQEAGVETVSIPGAGHWPFLDQHDAFVEATVRFLDRLSTR